MSNQGEEYQRSWILYNVLNRWIGSEEMVAIKRKGVIMLELVMNADKRQPGDTFYSGSRSEGFSMEGSDIDMMFIYNRVVVMCPDQENGLIPNLDNKSVLFMRHADSRPCYVSLELVSREQGWPCQMDNAVVPVGDKYFVSSDAFRLAFTDMMSRESKFNFEAHGPAANVFHVMDENSYDMDYVYSFKCPVWPKEANEWVIRPRLHGWPDKTLRDAIVRGGCYLVPVGDKTSTDTFLQWRISFATAERRLVHSLSHVQFLVYGLLKYLLKQISPILKNLLGGDTDILSSYIMKTAVFYAVENTPNSLWQEKNTFICFMWCLNILITWVKAGYCPNYFISNNNMFLGKFHGVHQRKLLSFLIDLHDMKWGCLSVGTFIQPSLGERIDSVMSGSWEMVRLPSSNLEMQRDMTLFTETRRLNGTLATLPLSLTLLSQTKTNIDEFFAFDVSAKGFSVAAMHGFDEYTSSVGNKEKYKSLRKCKNLLSPHASVSPSGLLTLGTYHYKTGNYAKSFDIYKHRTSPLIIFGDLTLGYLERYERLYCGRGYTLLQKFQEAFATPLSMLRHCSYFYPSQFEQIADIPFESRLTIPPLPYAVFLYFLCYHELGDTKQRDTALLDLRTLKYDDKQGGDQYWVVHNMLGICYELIGRTKKALRENRKSLCVRDMKRDMNPLAEWMERTT
ncbi:uncharacterized protein [Argopecten irradians]|uniref:uncharacterized protein n=1 Tax=Argopecten irradians TaxID=31199 RepID=UPI00371C21E1